MVRLHPNRHDFLDIRLANGFGQSSGGLANFSSSSAPVPPLHLTSKEDSTRVQLQKQKLREQHQHAIIVAQTQKIPGVKTTGAFFASLRTNLRLNASPPASPMSTPPSMRGSTGTLPPPSPLAMPAQSPSEHNETVPPEDPLAGVPELNTYLTSDDAEKVAALKLVADSVAQMRNIANNSLIYHPLNLTVLVAVLAFVVRYLLDKRLPPFTVGTTCTGILMISLVAIRYMTQNHLWAAEEINRQWLGNADVIITKFGDEVIGTAMIDWVSGEPRQRRKKAWRGEIKAWTVRLRYRRKGVGQALLEEAVKESRKKGAETIEFADEHANSKRVLPRFYNGKFESGESKARAMLQDQLEASPTRTRRKRGGSKGSNGSNG